MACNLTIGQSSEIVENPHHDVKGLKAEFMLVYYNQQQEYSQKHQAIIQIKDYFITVISMHNFITVISMHNSQT